MLKKMNYTFIRKIGDFLMLNSLQAHVNNLNNRNDKKRKVSKRYQDIFDRGCLFSDGSTTHPVIKPFQEVLKIHPSTNIADIIHLFFTKKQIRKKGDLPYPKIIKNAKSYQRGGEGGLSPLNISNSRRNIYDYKLSNSESSYIVKLAKHKIYSCAYKDEADIYKTMCNANNRCASSDGDVVKYIDSGIVSSNENNYTIKINDEIISLPEISNPEIQDMQYLVLENTDKLGFVDFKEYIEANENNRTNIFKVFNEIMCVIKKYNNEFGFFHGDLHTSNVKVKVDKGNGNIKVKLFDFDFAGILNPLKSQEPIPEKAIISSNIMAYKLTDSKGENIFQKSSNISGSTSANPESQSCEKVVMNKEYEYEYTKHFMYVFDYYRLLFSTLLELHIDPKNPKNAESLSAIKSLLQDEDNFNYTIIDWYSKQEDIVWKDCFRKSAFCKNIYQAQVNSQTPQQQQTCKKCENISPKIEELRQQFLERCKQGNISSCSISSTFSSFAGNASGGRKVVKRKVK